jgi:hypothetical protein
MPDERFITHRLRSTRFSVLVGTIVIFGIFTYNIVKHDVIRWDLFAIMLAMALAKVGAMIYLRRTN